MLAMTGPPVRVLKGLAIPARPRRRTTYNFDMLAHGDAIEVRNSLSAREVFRRWRKVQNKPHLALIPDPENENILFFVDERKLPARQLAEDEV